MKIEPQQVKQLRDKTGIGMMKCKKALEEAGGDMEKAIDILRKMGLDTAAKKGARATDEGLIGAYVHTNGKIAVLVEVQCETDFVAKSEDFLQLVKDLCFQVTAMRPIAVSSEDLPAEVLEKEKEVYREQVKGKPPEIMERIVEGKLKKFYEDACLLDQKFVKDNKKTIRDVVTEKVAKLGENIRVRRFVRFQLGEEG